MKVKLINLPPIVIYRFIQ